MVDSTLAETSLTFYGINARNVMDVCRIKMLPEQMEYCAHPAACIAQSKFLPQVDCEAIGSGGKLVGFLELDFPDPHTVHIWRLIIDKDHQRTGLGRQVVDHVKREYSSFHRFTAGVRRGPASPISFWLKQGFVPTGRVENDHVEVEFKCQ